MASATGGLMSTCTAKDVVWDYPCDKPADHVLWEKPEDRLHQHEVGPGETVTWGPAVVMREVFREAR